MPGLSVVIPNYNHSSYLEEAILSCFNQAKQPLEVIVVDDASTDDSISILNSICSRGLPIRLIQNPFNKGVEQSINIGLRECRGEYVLFRAADDVSLAGFFEDGIDSLERYPSAALCSMDIGFFGKTADRLRIEPIGLAGQKVFVKPAQWNELFGGNWISLASCIVRMKFARALGGLPVSCKWGSDWAFVMRLALEFGFVYSPVPGAAMRIGSASYNSKGSSDPLMQSSVRLEVLRYLENLSDSGRRALITSGVLDFWGEAMRLDYRQNENRFKSWMGDALSRPSEHMQRIRSRCGMRAVFREYIRLNLDLFQGKRIGIYGAGGHTRMLLSVWFELGLDPPCFVMESEQSEFSSIEGLTVKSIGEVKDSDFDAMLLSSKSYEPELESRFRQVFGRNKTVCKIWT